MKPASSRQGFTLIELLIATVVIATLMGVVFRLAGAGSDNRARARTIDRLQRIENALSGYYAAYGSYPPVPLQGRSRSIYKKVDGNGIQDDSGGDTGERISGSDAAAAWDKVGKQIQAACRAQPVAVYFPFNGKNSETRKMVQELSSHRTDKKFDVIQNTGGLDLEEEDWRKSSLFQFGLLSFLLPRYLFMLDGDNKLYDVVKNGRRVGQWAANNQLPCRMDTGDQYADWKELQKALHMGDFYNDGGSGVEASLISNLTSQSVCARWMPNFEKIISGGRMFYGVNTEDGEHPYLTTDENKLMAIFSKNGYSGGSGSGGSLYLLNGMTIRDGWGNEFYYYSEPPFQSYRLWSAGPDGRTFPVWYDIGQLNDSEKKIVQQWIADDISGLNN